MTCQYLSLNISNKLAIITFQRESKKNALNPDMYKGLTKLLNDISERDDVNITAITGLGDYYSSGNDLKSSFTASEDIEATLNNATDMIRKFVEAFILHKKILVAVVNGPAVGIAVTTLPLCDVVYCTENAWFLTPFTSLGICAEGCSSYTFPKIFGTSLANDLLIFNRKLNAQEALAAGFVSKIVKRENLQTEVWNELQKHAKYLSCQSLSSTKKLMRRFDERQLHEANMLECAELRKLFLTDEAREAKIKFVSRRSNL